MMLHNDSNFMNIILRFELYQGAKLLFFVAAAVGIYTMSYRMLYSKYDNHGARLGRERRLSPQPRNYTVVLLVVSAKSVKQHACPWCCNRSNRALSTSHTTVLPPESVARKVRSTIYTVSSLYWDILYFPLRAWIKKTFLLIRSSCSDSSPIISFLKKNLNASRPSERFFTSSPIIITSISTNNYYYTGLYIYYMEPAIPPFGSHSIIIIRIWWKSCRLVVHCTEVSNNIFLETKTSLHRLPAC